MRSFAFFRSMSYKIHIETLCMCDDMQIPSLAIGWCKPSVGSEAPWSSGQLHSRYLAVTRKHSQSKPIVLLATRNASYAHHANTCAPYPSTVTNLQVYYKKNQIHPQRSIQTQHSDEISCPCLRASLETIEACETHDFSVTHGVDCKRTNTKSLPISWISKWNRVIDRPRVYIDNKLKSNHVKFHELFSESAF